MNDLIDTDFIGRIADSVAVISQLLGSDQKKRARKNAGLLLVVAVVLGAWMYRRVDFMPQRGLSKEERTA